MGGLSKVLHFLPYPFILAEMRNGTFANIFTNQKFNEEIGYSTEEIKTIDEWFKKAYPDRNYREEVKIEWARRGEEARQSGVDFFTMPARLCTKNGAYRWYEIKVSILGSVHFVAFINIHNEITAREELSKVNENKNRILSILSHDLRTPLNTLHGTLNLLSTNSMTETEKSEVLRTLTHQVFRLGEFLDTTLHWSRANFQDMVIHPQRFDVNAVIEDIVSLYSTSSASKKIQINVAIENRNRVHGDPGVFSIVFRNLLSNAIKFTPANGTIRIYDSVRNENYTLNVENSGNGISQNKIFEILNGNSASEPGTSGEKGLGLGLNLCLQLLRKSGGNLEIESIDNSRAIFKVVMQAIVT